MIKNIKRAGIIFLAVAIICLMVTCCLSVNSVTSIGGNVGILSSEKSNSADSNVNSSENYSIGELEYEIPKAEKEYTLTCDCSIGTPCSCGQMANTWAEAVYYSIENNVNVKVTLLRDWIAKDNSTYITCFGEGRGFDYGKIAVPQGGNITLDLNGNNIDRKLTQTTVSGHVILVYSSTLNIVDSQYNSQEILQLANAYEKGVNETIMQVNKGIITGANVPSNTNSGAIRLSGNGAKLNFYSGIVKDNISGLNGGAIGISDSNASCVINIYGGMLINNKSKDGGAIYVNVGSQLNVCDGIIICNEASSGGGGIAVNQGECNIYGGLLIQNRCWSSYGGAILAKNSSTLCVYGGIIKKNEASTWAAGIMISDHSHLDMYGGLITENESNNGAGVSLGSASTANIYDCNIINNKSRQNSSGLLVWYNSSCVMYSGVISGNETAVVAANKDYGGGGVLVGEMSNFTMYDGEISNNKAYTLDSAVPACGGGILISCYKGSYGTVKLLGGRIINNLVEGQEGVVYGGGVSVTATENFNGEIYVGANIQIYGNTTNNKPSDVYLPDTNIKLNIDGNLTSNSGEAYIGIKLCDEYGSEPFTNMYRYGIYNNKGTSYKRHFFSNDEDKIPTVVGREIAMTTGDKPIDKVLWSWTGRNAGNTYDTNFSVAYTGEPYVIKMQDEDFQTTSSSTIANSFTIEDVGIYSFFTTASYSNPTFTFTILPKEVDVLWNNTNMVYNGGTQKPTAYIAEDSNCKVTVIGEQINSGNGYVATATSLSNTNYKINSKTMNKTFSIAKAKLQKPNGSGSYEYNGEEHTFEPNGYNFVTMNISGNKQTEVGSYNAVVSIKDKLNYMWADGTNADITIPYAITLAPPVNEENGVYRFIYYDEADGTRKTYKDGGLVHGINDSEVNGGKAIIGNIAPNTSVKVFIENLGFDTNNIQLFAGNKLVYDKTNGYALNDNNYDNGRELAVGTGWYINYTAVNGEVETIYLSVLGDLTGDGKVNSADVNYLRQIVNNNSFESLSAEQKLSALIVNKGKEPTSTDVQILWEAVCGRIDINEFI